MSTLSQLPIDEPTILGQGRPKPEIPKLDYDYLGECLREQLISFLEDSPEIGPWLREIINGLTKPGETSTNEFTRHVVSETIADITRQIDIFKFRGPTTTIRHGDAQSPAGAGRI